MKATFDPATERRLLDGETGYEWHLNRTFEEVADLKALTSVAHADLQVAMHCILVSYDDPASLLVRRAREWLSIAADRDEPSPRFGAHFIRAQRYQELALCSWLLDGIHDVENLRRYLVHEDLYRQGTNALDRVGVSLACPELLNAGDDRGLLDLLMRAGIVPPSSFSAIRTEGQMAYVLVRKQLGEAHEDDDVDKALAAFLARNVNGWLLDGHYIRAALWMKIAHWREDGVPSPLEVVRRCYDYLPGVTLPPPV